jgi:hypothetical protein
VDGVVILPHFSSVRIILVPQVNIFLGNELLWNALPQARYLENVFTVEERGPASLVGDGEGAICLGGGSR